MIQCQNPIQLKTGLVVPCGKCVLCLTKRRDEWSHRLQLHSYGYNSMPLFCGLTYDDDHLKFGVDVTLVPRDLSLFIKRIKENFKLYDTNFSFFACGEYGDSYGRPHYHILFFGFDALSDKFDVDWLGAHQLLRANWQNGNVDIGRARWSGVHYVTKYVLKYDGQDYPDQKPFLSCSHGIGLPWFETDDCRYLKDCIRKAFSNRGLTLSVPDDDDFENFMVQVKDDYYEMQSKFPRLVAHTPQGYTVPLPRYLKDRLIGHFDHFTDNAYWLINYYRELIDSYEYLKAHSDYDREVDVSYSKQVIQARVNKIRKRVYLQSKPIKNETIRIGSNQKTCL